MTSEPTIPQIGDWLAMHYGNVSTETAVAAVLAAERGLSFGGQANQVLQQALSQRDLSQFQAFLSEQSIQSHTFGNVSGSILNQNQILNRILTHSQSLWESMPLEPELFGANPEGYRGVISFEGHIEDALERYRMDMYLSGDETWLDLIQSALDRAIDLAKYYPDRLKGKSAIQSFEVGFSIVTGARKF